MQVLYHEGPGEIKLRYKTCEDMEPLVERLWAPIEGWSDHQVKTLCNIYVPTHTMWKMCYKLTTRERPPSQKTAKLIDWLITMQDKIEYVMIYVHSYARMFDIYLPRSDVFFERIKPLCSEETILRLLKAHGFCTPSPFVLRPEPTIFDELIAAILRSIPGTTVQHNGSGWYYVYFRDANNDWGYANARLNKLGILRVIREHPAAWRKYEELILGRDEPAPNGDELPDVD